MLARLRRTTLNAGLVTALALVAGQGRVKWQEAQAERSANLNVPIKRITPPRITPAQRPEAVQAAEYLDVAAKNLFSKDRNPTVVADARIELPKVMPPLPVIFGVIGLPGGDKAIMSERSGAPSRSVQTGDVVGEFTILALDLRKVTFEWDGRQLDVNLDDPRRPLWRN